MRVEPIEPLPVLTESRRRRFERISARKAWHRREEIARRRNRALRAREEQAKLLERHAYIEAAGPRRLTVFKTPDKKPKLTTSAMTALLLARGFRGLAQKLRKA
jgi:hypothetical protein